MILSKFSPSFTAYWRTATGSPEQPFWSYLSFPLHLKHIGVRLLDHQIDRYDPIQVLPFICSILAHRYWIKRSSVWSYLSSTLRIQTIGVYRGWINRLTVMMLSKFPPFICSILAHRYWITRSPVWAYLSSILHIQHIGVCRYWISRSTVLIRSKLPLHLQHIGVPLLDHQSDRYNPI